MLIRILSSIDSKDVNLIIEYSEILDEELNIIYNKHDLVKNAYELR